MDILCLNLQNGLVLDEEVHYVWIPPKCGQCVSFNHTEELCPMKAFKVAKEVEKGVIMEAMVACKECQNATLMDCHVFDIETQCMEIRLEAQLWTWQILWMPQEGDENNVLHKTVERDIHTIKETQGMQQLMPAIKFYTDGRVIIHKGNKGHMKLVIQYP